jgi:P27 family predicted phage terminase small subunit
MVKSEIKKSAKSNAPTNLSVHGLALYRRLIDEYCIDDGAGLLLVATACESSDRLREAQAILKKQGLLVKDRFRQSKPHPACSIERDARTQLLAALRALRLDPEEVGD